MQLLNWHKRALDQECIAIDLRRTAVPREAVFTVRRVIEPKMEDRSEKDMQCRAGGGSALEKRITGLNIAKGTGALMALAIALSPATVTAAENNSASSIPVSACAA